MHYWKGDDGMSHDLWTYDSDIVIAFMVKERIYSIRTILVSIPQFSV